MFLKKNIIQHQQNIEKLIIDYKLLKKAMNFLYKKRIIKVGKKVIIGLAIDRTYMELTNMKGLIVVISSFFLFYIDIWELLSYHYSEFYSPYI